MMMTNERKSILTGLIFVVIAGNAAATVLTFDGTGTNVAITDFGSNVSANGTGFNVSNGATPNVALSWSNSGPGVFWEFYNDSEWSAAQLQGFNDGIPTHHDILFTPEAGYGVIVNSFVFDDYTTWMGGNHFTWTLFRNDTFGTVIATGTETTADGLDLPVNTGMAAAYAGPVLLRITAESDPDTPTNDDQALDTMSFNQVLIGPPVAQIVESEGATVVIEAGDSDSFETVLLDQPSANVTVTVTPSGSHAGDIFLNEATAGAAVEQIFTAEDWSIPQSVTVLAVDDVEVENLEMATLQFAMTSTDPNFNNGSFTPADELTMNIYDNDGPHSGDTVEVKVMTFNILAGGTALGQPIQRTVDIIAAAGADIIGLQERGGSAQNIADGLGFFLHNLNSSTVILSRWPITETFSDGVKIQFTPLHEVYMFGVHLTAYPYQPYDIRDGSITNEADAITAASATRNINPVLTQMAPLIAAGEPVFLVGDFNEPSHLDWTAEAALAGLHAFKVAWPTSTNVANAGMIDAYRTIYPDEVAKTAYTWTPTPGANEVHDRIDLIYHAGNNLTVVNAQNYGEAGPNTDVADEPWPSDHRAVVATYNLLLTCPFNLAGDFNNDCVVNIVDFALTAQNWLVDCELTLNNNACMPD